VPSEGFRLDKSKAIISRLRKLSTSYYKKYGYNSVFGISVAMVMKIYMLCKAHLRDYVTSGIFATIPKHLGRTNVENLPRYSLGIT
jgi:hypothetical protein